MARSQSHGPAGPPRPTLARPRALAFARIGRWTLPLALGIALAPLLAAGCGTSASGVNDCKTIEEARCNAAAKCSAISLSPPYSTNGSATDACIRYYDTACLHGLAGNQPSNGQLQDCVTAIQTGGCAVVETPWKDARCSWLIPPNTPEAGAEAGEGGSEGGDAASADGAGE